jgi:hypothetical protein
MPVLTAPMATEEKQEEGDEIEANWRQKLARSKERAKKGAPKVGEGKA